MNLSKLKDPFPVEKISWRLGATNAKKNNGVATKGIPLAYIDARDVMERLDDVCGPDGWQCKYPFAGCCEIGIYIPPGLKKEGEWVWKSNGAGETDVEAEKGQYSDAFKRAAVLWGIGRYLYDFKCGWVDVKDNKIADSSMQKLNATLLAYNKKCTSGTSVINGSTGVWDGINDEDSIALRELAGEVIGYFETGSISGCLEIIDMAQLPVNHEVALWTLIVDSKVRSTIKAALAINKATDMDALKSAWEEAPKHALKLLEPVKESKKLALKIGDKK